MKTVNFEVIFCVCLLICFFFSQRELECKNEIIRHSSTCENPLLILLIKTGTCISFNRKYQAEKTITFLYLSEHGETFEEASNVPLFLSKSRVSQLTELVSKGELSTLSVADPIKKLNGQE